MNRMALEMFISVGIPVLCIVLGIIAIAIFFAIFNRVNVWTPGPDSMRLRGILKKGDWAKVHMTGGEKFDRVKFVGFTDSNSIKNNLPFELSGMVILEDEQESRFLVRAKSIKMIVIEKTK